MGIGIYPAAALINHSCRPNVAHAFRNGSEIAYHAIRRIQAGESITAAYVELAATAQERRQWLCDLYHFDPAGPAAGLSGGGADAAQLPASAGARPAADEPTVGAPVSGAAATAQLPPPDAYQPSSSAKTGDSVYPAPLCTLRLPGGAVLQVFGADEVPPWPVDPQDAALTRLAAAGKAPRCTVHYFCILTRCCNAETKLPNSEAASVLPVAAQCWQQQGTASLAYLHVCCSSG